MYDPSYILQPEKIEVDESLSYEEKPVRILDTKSRDTRRKSIKLIKVQWFNHSPEEATWEVEDVMREKYPSLFESGETLSPYLSAFA